MRGLLSLDALIALIIISLLAAWIGQFVPVSASQSASFGSVIQSKAAAISAGMQANAMFAAGINSFTLVPAKSAILGSDLQVTVAKDIGTPATADYGGVQSSYPAANGVYIQNGVLKK